MLADPVRAGVHQRGDLGDVRAAFGVGEGGDLLRPRPGRQRDHGAEPVPDAGVDDGGDVAGSGQVSFGDRGGQDSGGVQAGQFGAAQGAPQPLGLVAGFSAVTGRQGVHQLVAVGLVPGRGGLGGPDSGGCVGCVVALTDPGELEAQEERVLEHANDLPIAELAKMPESQTLEFKSSLRYDLKTGGVNKALEQVIVKSVAGLTNASGGVLLVGVADDGEIVGIEKDVQMLPKRQDKDGYENHLTTLLENGLGSAATANVGAQFEQVDGHTVCRVTVQPSSSPVWTKLKGQEDAFYVRLGNSTRPFGPRDAHEYISHHFR